MGAWSEEWVVGGRAKPNPSQIVGLLPTYCYYCCRPLAEGPLVEWPGGATATLAALSAAGEQRPGTPHGTAAVAPEECMCMPRLRALCERGGVAALRAALRSLGVHKPELRRADARGAMECGEPRYCSLASACRGAA